MKEVDNLIADIKSGETELADLRLHQIIKDKISIAVEQQKIEVANKIFNEGLTNVNNPSGNVLTEAVTSPWKLRTLYRAFIDKKYGNNPDEYIPGYEPYFKVPDGKFNDAHWKEDLATSKKKSSLNNVPESAKNSKPHIIWDYNEEDFIIYGNSIDELKKYAQEITKHIACPWKLRMLDTISNIEKYVPGRGSSAKGTFNDEDWEDDQYEFRNENQSDLPQAARKAKPIYMISSGYGDLVIYGNSEAEIKKRLKEYEAAN